MVDRRAAGQPLEHVLGWAEFCGLRIAVDPGVFVPRRRTEFLVRQAAALARPGAVVVGPVLRLRARWAPRWPPPGRVELHAADIDPAAVRCARRNVAAAGGTVYQGDLYEPLPAGAARPRRHPASANVPYVPTEASGCCRPRRGARAAGGAGRRRGRAGRPAPGGRRGAAWLAPGGHLLVETSERQAPRPLAAVRPRGLTARWRGPRSTAPRS